MCTSLTSLSDYPVNTGKDGHEEQGADQNRDDIDRDLRVAEPPHVDEAVGVLVGEGPARQRVCHPRERDQ